MLRYVLVFQTGLRRSYACDGHTEGGAAYVVHAEFGAELNRRGFAAMFAADTHFEFGLGATAFAHAHFHELTYAFLVEHFERVCLCLLYTSDAADEL